MPSELGGDQRFPHVWPREPVGRHALIVFKGHDRALRHLAVRPGRPHRLELCGCAGPAPAPGPAWRCDGSRLLRRQSVGDAGSARCEVHRQVAEISQHLLQAQRGA